MKKAKKLVVTIALALAVAFCVSALCACGGSVKLDAGSYEGVYKVVYTEDGATVRNGAKVTFGVDDKNCIWDISYAAADADWEGAETGAKYTAPAIATGAPWNAGKAAAQFSGWTVSEFMSITVEVDENGMPKGEGCVKSKKEITIGVGCDVGIGYMILAVQDVIRANAK